MSESETTPTLADLWAAAFNARLETVFTSLPGIVQSYDRNTQKADIKPAIRVPRRSRAGEVTYVDLPVISSVKVLFPCSKRTVYHFDLERGDGVQLNFNMREFGEWLRTAGVVNPQDLRTHSPAGVTASLGFNPDGDSMAVMQDVLLQIGVKDGPQLVFKASTIEADGASDAVALASPTNDQLNDLKAAINGWTPIANDGGAALKLALTAWIADVAAVGSAVLKVGS